jgi:hypothetical protein
LIDLLERDQEIVRDVMSKCTIVRAECHLAKRAIEYTAFSELFDELEFGRMIPDYIVVYTTCEDDKTTWEFKRKN